MLPFTFSQPTRIVFGPGTADQVGAETARLAKRVLLHYAGGSITASGLYERVLDSLRTAGVEWVELGGVVPNPRLALVREGIALCRAHHLSAVVAVGGGSVLDSAKAIGMGVSYTGDVWDFFTGKATPTAMLPLATVLTLPAAGSEASPSTVVTDEETLNKRSCTTDILRPTVSILDPALTTTLPPYQTACGAADMMSHVIERYFTNVDHVDLTDRLCEAVLRSVIANAPRCLADANDLHARSEIMWAGCIAHNDLVGTGRNGDWASHMIEHELSGFDDVAHGAGLAVVIPAWMRHVIDHDPARFAQFAVRVFDVEPNLRDLRTTGLEGIHRLQAFWRSLGLPATLSELGTSLHRLDEMATRATAAGPIGNFVVLDRNGARAVLELAKTPVELVR